MAKGNVSISISSLTNVFITLKKECFYRYVLIFRLILQLGDDLALLAEDLDLRCGFEISLRRDLIEHSLCIVGSECGVGANRT